MKKFYFLMSAFLLSMTMMMVSCGSDKKSGDDKEKEENASKLEQLVCDMEKKADAYVAALEKGDKEAADKIEAEVKELMKGNKETVDLVERLMAVDRKTAEALNKYYYENNSSSDNRVLLEDDDDTTVESYEFEDADYGMDIDDAESLGF